VKSPNNRVREKRWKYNLRGLPLVGGSEFAGRFGRARIGILTFTDEEHAAAKAVFECDGNISTTPFYVRDPNADDHDLVLIEGERSNTPAGQAVAELIAAFRPSFVMTCGTAGTKSGRGPGLGDVVVCDFVQYYEFAKVISPKTSAVRRLLNRITRRDIGWRVLPRHVAYDHPAHFLRHSLARAVMNDSGKWIGRIATERPSKDSKPPGVHTGMILCGEKILSAYSSREQQDLLTLYDKACAIDTESYGVAKAVFRARTELGTFGRHYNPMFLPVRAISDVVDHPTAEKQRPAWTRYAAEAACAFARDVSERLLEDLPK
jgi:nucleoside phosphorylase